MKKQWSGLDCWCLKYHCNRADLGINLARLEHSGCLLEALALLLCSKYAIKIIFFLFQFWFRSILACNGLWLLPLGRFWWSHVQCTLMCPLQVARAILENPNDKTKVHLIYANVTYEDILLKVSCSSIFFWCSIVAHNQLKYQANVPYAGLNGALSEWISCSAIYLVKY